jgi:hypothetical protein
MTPTMPHRSGSRTAKNARFLGTSLLAVGAAAGAASLLVAGLAGCSKDQLQGPAAEVKKIDVKLDMPKVPAFDLPASAPDSHSVKELRVKGTKLLGTDVTVTGYITWAYDCATAIRQPGMTDKDVEKAIADDPTKCERPKFYIGDAADTPVEKSVWVVDVPRPYNKLEKERLPKEELKNPPPDKCDDAKKTCPPYKVGDQITIKGAWTTSSPHSERNSDGLIVYKSLKNTTQSWETPPPDPNAPPPGGAAPGATGAPAGGPPPPGAKASPEDLVKKKPH